VTHIYDFSNKDGALGFKAALAAAERTQLEAAVFNKRYNDFCDTWCDESGDNTKLIPYMGWFWRSCDFFNGRVCIGKGEYGFVAVMENNKWDYAYRYLTPDEVATFMDFLDRAISESSKGGILSEINEKTRIVLRELSAWMQTLGAGMKKPGSEWS